MNYLTVLLRAQIPVVVLVLAPLPALALDYSLSGFGTAGYARSDQSYNYERFTNRDGTFKRDSILGAQLNADFNTQWSATLQATVAPSTSDDRKWVPTMTWAFLSYRPSNDLLFRAGKLRMPMYLFSENMSVGVSYDVMHLPTEVYSTAPTTDFSGASFSKTWGVAEGELGLEGYWGRTKLTVGSQSATSGEQTTSDLRTRSGGTVLSYRQDDNVYRVGMQQAFISASNTGAGQTPGGGGTPGIPAGGGSPGPSGPPIATDSGGASIDIDTRVLLLGIDQNLGHDFRLITEFARRHAENAVIPKNSHGAYLTLLKKIGPWTPYVTVARLLTDKNARVSGTSVVNNFDDQSSWSFGASYRLSPNQKIKGEWMRTHFGASTTLVNQSATVSNQTLNVFSLSYNFAF